LREQREGRGQSDLAPLGEARANRFNGDAAGPCPQAAAPGLHRFDSWDLADLRRVIDWTPSSAHGSCTASIPPSSTTPSRQGARSLFHDAEALLDQIIDG
jgi:5-methyltetrahydrofolate--homocysteine methyltransferase